MKPRDGRVAATRASRIPDALQGFLAFTRSRGSRTGASDGRIKAERKDREGQASSNGAGRTLNSSCTGPAWPLPQRHTGTSPSLLTRVNVSADLPRLLRSGRGAVLCTRDWCPGVGPTGPTATEPPEPAEEAPTAARPPAPAAAVTAAAAAVVAVADEGPAAAADEPETVGSAPVGMAAGAAPCAGGPAAAADGPGSAKPRDLRHAATWGVQLVRRGEGGGEWGYRPAGNVICPIPYPADGWKQWSSVRLRTFAMRAPQRLSQLWLTSRHHNPLPHPHPRSTHAPTPANTHAPPPSYLRRQVHPHRHQLVPPPPPPYPQTLIHTPPPLNTHAARPPPT